MPTRKPVIDIRRTDVAPWANGAMCVQFKYAYRVVGAHNNTVEGYSNKSRRDVESLARTIADKMVEASGRRRGLPDMTFGHPKQAAA